MKCGAAAASSIRGWPSLQSSTPSASLTATRWRACVDTRAQQAADDQRHGGRQRMGREALGRLVGVEHHRCGAVGIDPGGRGSAPTS